LRTNSPFLDTSIMLLPTLAPAAAAADDMIGGPRQPAPAKDGDGGRVVEEVATAGTAIAAQRRVGAVPQAAERSGRKRGDARTSTRGAAAAAAATATAKGGANVRIIKVVGGEDDGRWAVGVAVCKAADGLLPWPHEQPAHLVPC